MGAKEWFIALIGSGILAGVISVSSAAGGLTQQMSSVAADVESIDERFTRFEAAIAELKGDIATQGAQDKIFEARISELEKRNK